MTAVYGLPANLRGNWAACTKTSTSRSVSTSASAIENVRESVSVGISFTESVCGSRGVNTS